ncbi:D-alanyl-D-alanine carboxypeptidase family protein [Blastococcus sp. SYSU D00813]
MRGGVWRRAGAVLAAAVVLVSGGGPALADDPPRPTVDPTAPTPTAPYPGLPPQGSAPGGGTVGGEALDTRGVVVADGTPPLPAGIAAPGWLVADAVSGEVLAARDPHGRYYPASTLKTLTLLTLAPLLDPAQVVEGTVEDEQVEGSRVGLVAGGRYPVSLLFLALVLQSGNDAANALARAAGGVDATLAAMNATAEEIGAFDTVAGTPSGLDVAGQSSSPYDLALVFRRLVADPVTAAVLRTPIAQMPPVEGRSPGYQIQNQNPLSGHPGDLGGKTGFTDAARHTFVTAAERDGRRLVVSVMGTENLPLRAADQAALLLDWGFATGPGTEGVGRLVGSRAEALATAAESAEESAEETSSAPATRSAPPAGSEPAAAATDGGGGDGTPAVVGGVLVVAAAGVVAATVVGRRRAVRRPRTRSDAGSPSTRP